ncbi:MAG: pyruvate formate-lyase [Dehalococcoidia bacterium]|nr:MAG: pyruvate formate-lyase [Dehalococcoidia bacterium]
MAKKPAIKLEHRLLSSRVDREKEALLSAEPRVDTEKIKFQLEVYRANAEQPAIIKRARLFNKLCREKKIFIDDNPLVGTLTRYKYGSYPIPEFGSRWLKKTDAFSLQRGKASVTKEDLKLLHRAAEYWWDASVFNRTKEIMAESRGVDIGLLQKCGLGTEYTPGGFGNVTPDFATVLSKGLNGVLAGIAKKKAELDTSQAESVAKWHFYTAAALCLEGFIALADRYAGLAEEMSRNESNPERRRELKQIARICRRVPAKPASNFREALQSVWFVQLGTWMESPFVLNCPPGRFPQYLYHFYREDVSRGLIDDEAVIELIQFYFLKLNGLAQVLPPHGFAWSQSRLGLHLCIGGLSPDGADATNELDWLVLEAQYRIRLPEPLVDLMYHDKLSPEFLQKCVELIKTGLGQPAVHNVEKAIARHIYHQQMPLSEARDLSIVGCVQSWRSGYSLAPWEGAFNIAKMVELALNDGKDPLTGLQLGPHTGEAESFRSYNEFYQALLSQMKHFIRLQREIGSTAWKVERDFPIPFASALTNDCVARGLDVMDGGARYHQGNGMTFVGGIDAANSLAAIRELIFKNKLMTMARLKQALVADFKSHESVLQMCQRAPKYGNDDESVDAIARSLYEVCYAGHQKSPDFLGRHSKPEAYSVVTHFATGRFTGALPSGRRAGTPLTDASVSASPGTDTGGPTALIKSAARTIDTVKFGSNHLNMKFHPSVFSNLQGDKNLMALIKTYFDLGGYHVQFNCVSSKTLLEAQRHPEKYRDLVVRVAGFSAFFVHLDREVQDEIIKRTELTFS